MGHFTNRGDDQQSVQKHIQLVLEIDAFITGEFKIRMIHFLLAGENRYYQSSKWFSRSIESSIKFSFICQTGIRATYINCYCQPLFPMPTSHLPCVFVSAKHRRTLQQVDSVFSYPEVYSHENQTKTEQESKIDILSVLTGSYSLTSPTFNYFWLYTHKACIYD